MVTIIIIFIYQVTEEEYAKLVAKRRKENANFVVGAEENDEYVDMGEEEDWTRENPAYRDDEGDDEDGRNNANACMDADDEDQRWADERRAVGRAEDPTTRDDDRDDDDRCVLSCACCFVDVSVDASPASRRDDGRYVASRVTNVAMGDGGSEGPRRDPAEGRRGGMPFRCEACGEALGTVDGGGESRRRFRFDAGAVVPSTA